LDSKTIKTEGLDKLDSKQKDLLRIITIKDALNGIFEYTSTYSPRTYAESIENIPTHLTVQGLIFCRPSEKIVKIIKQISDEYTYEKTEYDKFYVSENIDLLTENNILIIMNRRVGGWDGSLDRPVIELLGAGGHVPTIFDTAQESFITLTPNETILKEAEEEIGITLTEEDIELLGGFHNKVSSELVLLYGIFVNEDDLLKLQEKAFGNIEENIDGLYIGEFNEVMARYKNDATPFAGGEKAKPSNFPSQEELMSRIKKMLA